MHASSASCPVVLVREACWLNLPAGIGTQTDAAPPAPAGGWAVRRGAPRGAGEV